MTIITRQVGQSSDDCKVDWLSSAINLIANFCVAGYSVEPKGSGMRFTNITIPQGATIKNAFLTFKCFFASAGVDCKTRISAEKVASAGTFVNNFAIFQARWNNRTIARVDWDNIPAWVLLANYDSPEIKSVIQEVVNQVLWVSGNDIVLFWEDFEDRSTHNIQVARYGYSFDGSAPDAITLTVEVEYVILKEMNETIGITEMQMRRGRINKIANETISLVDSAVRRLRSIRIMNETISLVDSAVRRLRSIRIMNETIGIADHQQGVKYTLHYLRMQISRLPIKRLSVSRLPLYRWLRSVFT